jgi:aspartyl-tRNA(Asn)/glutamyl-tRNA(Gln) amidotransferase subunit A
MARRIRDVVYALDLVVGPDPSDLHSLPMPEASWSRSLEELHPPARVGWSPTLGYAKVDPEVLAVCEAAVKRLEERGTEVVVIDDVFDEDPVMLWLAIGAVGNLRSLEPYRGTEAWERIDPGLLGTLTWAESVTPTGLMRSLDACHLLNLRLVELFHRVPLLLTPAVAGQTARAGGQGTIDGVEDVSWVRFTYPFNMARSPAGVVSAGFLPNGLPVGLQVVGPQHADTVVLRALALLEDTLDLDTVAPMARA